MKILHIVPGLDDTANGMVVVARLLAKEQGDAEVVDLNQGVRKIYKCDCGVVWVHGMWHPSVWAICIRVIKAGKRLVRMTHGSLSPVYLKNQSPIKKWLVRPIERYLLRRCEKIVATCGAEAEWVRMYLGKKCPEIVVEDLRRFFDLNRVERVDRVEGDSLGFRVSGFGLERDENNSQLTTHNSQLNLLYLGRRHPLKGVEYLEEAVKELVASGQSLVVSEGDLPNSNHETRNIELKIVSNAFGEELEKVWDWCDVLVLPTLSENFGLVVAEALERGKRVITTDGAPAWDDGNDYGGLLIYIRGFMKASDDERITMLKQAIESVQTK